MQELAGPRLEAEVQPPGPLLIVAPSSDYGWQSVADDFKASWPTVADSMFKLVTVLLRVGFEASNRRIAGERQLRSCQVLCFTDSSFFIDPLSFKILTVS